MSERTIAKETTRTTKIRLINDCSLHFFRSVGFNDVPPGVWPYPRAWAFYWGDLRGGQLHFRTPNGRVSTRGKMACFASPDSLIHWELASSKLSYSVFLSFSPLPDFLQGRAFIFDYPEQQPPYSSEDVVEILKKVKLSQEVGLQGSGSIIAQRLKAYLDENYIEPTNIAEIAKEFNCSRSLLNKDFMEAYSISPGAYRNKIRLLRAKHFLYFHQGSITDIAFEVGFQSLNHFRKQFRRLTTLTPSDYARLVLNPFKNRPRP